MKSLASFFVFFAILTGTATAATTPWVEAHGGKLRLIAPGGASADGSIRAGIEIVLEPGWKTYWRQPGDAGIPPYFDHSASKNVDELRIDFPAPKRFDDLAGITIGYKDSVVLPVVIKPKDPSAPVVLDLAVEYGLCEEICVPASAKVRLELDGATAADPAARQALDAFAATVPVSDDRTVRSVDRQGDMLIVHTAGDDQDAPLNLYVEGPEDWYLPPAEKAEANGDSVKWHLALKWVPKKAKLAGTELRFTLIAGNNAFEQVWRLD